MKRNHSSVDDTRPAGPAIGAATALHSLPFMLYRKPQRQQTGSAVQCTQAAARRTSATGQWHCSPPDPVGTPTLMTFTSSNIMRAVVPSSGADCGRPPPSTLLTYQHKSATRPQPCITPTTSLLHTHTRVYPCTKAPSQDAPLLVAAGAELPAFSVAHASLPTTLSTIVVCIRPGLLRHAYRRICPCHSLQHAHAAGWPDARQIAFTSSRILIVGFISSQASSVSPGA